MTKNRTRTPVYLDPGMHPGLEVKGLTVYKDHRPITCKYSNEEERTKSFMTFQIEKDPLISMVCITIFQRCKG